MPKKKKNEKPTEQEVIAARRKDVSEMYRSGMLLIEIAAELGVNRSTIHRDMKAIRQAWIESPLYDYHEHVNREMAKLDKIEEEAWEAWYRSVEQQTTQMAGTRSLDGKYIEKKTQVVKRDGVGDPKYLLVIQRCIEQRCRLLGLNQPERIADPDGRPLGSSLADRMASVFQAINQTKKRNNVISIEAGK